MEAITLGGRKFVVLTNGSLEHDFWMMSQIQAAGLDRVEMKADEDAQAFAMRLMREIIESGKFYAILGGMLLPDGMKAEHWTANVAETTAEHLRGLTDPQDKNTAIQFSVSVLLTFFAKGLASVVISSTYSTSTGSQPENAVASTSANGAASSASWLVTTWRGIRKFFAGLFGRR